MIKNGMAVLAALALVATLAHADDYLSPTDERVRLSLGRHACVHRPPTCRLDSSRVCRARSINAEDAFGLDKSGLRAQISGHGAGRRAAPPALRLFHPGSNRADHAHRIRSYFATWSCRPAIR